MGQKEGEEVNATKIERTHKLDQRTKPSGTSRDYQLASALQCS